jgi:hypothetical protein
MPAIHQAEYYHIICTHIYSIEKESDDPEIPVMESNYENITNRR